MLGLRPAAIRLGTGSLSGRVEDLEPHGRETIYHLSTPLGALRALEPGSARLDVGDQVPIALETVLLFDAATERRLESGPLRCAA
jgi:inositol-phosphate transport system ATP-binding protein